MRNIRFYALIAALALIYFTPLLSQNTDKPYGLLWELKAPGAAEPSYLFGTMHVADEKIFRLPDSVFIGIENTAGFATEVAFDDALNELVRRSYEQEETVDNSAERAWLKEQIKTLLTGKSEDGTKSREISDDPSPLQVLNELGKDYEPGSERETFLDAFLYRVARDAGKVVGGVEEIEDQINILLDPDGSRIGNSGDRLNSGSLKSLYITGDLEAIRSYMEGPDVSAEWRQKLLTDRNYGMVETADSLIQVRPTFIAVGAAHLPGEEGVIELFRKHGYKVRRVEATYEGLVEQYLDQPYQPRWRTFEDMEQGLSMQVPTDPFKIKIPDKDLAMNYGMDLPAGFVYTAYRYHIGPKLQEVGQTEFLENLEQNMKLYYSKETNDIDRNGLSGREYFTFLEGEFFRLRVLFDSSSMVFAMVGPTETTARSDAAAQLLNSVKTFAPESPFSAPLRPFRLEEISAQIDLPTAPEHSFEWTNTEEDRQYWSRTHEHTITDKVNKIEFSLQHNQLPPMHSYLSDSGHFEDIMAFLREATSLDSLKYEIVERNGIQGFETRTAYDGDSMQLRMIYRGDQFYQFLLTTPENDSRASLFDQMVNSFKYLPANVPSLTYKYEDDHLQAMLPGKPIVIEDSDEYSYFPGVEYTREILHRDSLSSASLSMYHIRFSDLFRPAHPDSLMEYFEDLPKGTTASGPNYSAFLGDMTDLNEEGYLYTTIDSSEMMQQRSVIDYRIKGNDLFLLSLSGNNDAPTRALMNQFRRNVRFKNDEPIDALFQPKADRIFAAIHSEDEDIREEAEAYLYEYFPTDSEIQSYITALEGAGELSLEAEKNIALQLAFHDTEPTREAIRRKFHAFQHPEIQADILNEIGRRTNPERLELLRELLEDEREITQTDNSLRQMYLDIYDYDSTIFNSPEWVNVFLHHPLPAFGFASFLAGEIEFMEEPNPVLLDGVHMFRDLLMDPNYRNALPDTGNFDFEDMAHLFVYSTFNMDSLNPQDIEFLQYLAEEAPTQILRTQAMLNLIYVDEAVKVDWLETSLQNPRTSPMVISALTSWEELEILPKEYQKREYIAEQLLRRNIYVEETDYTTRVARVEFLKKEKVDWEGESRFVYTYKFSLEGDPNWRLGVSGPFPKEKNAFPTGTELTGMSGDHYHPRRYDDMLSEYLREKKYERINEE